jgi:adenylate cyclase class IV
MAQNIEIKARARDFARQYGLAERLADGPVTVIRQRDVFFEVPRGRLKLRYFSEDEAELIAYHRADDVAPKTSEYEIYPCPRPVALERTLALLLPVRGTVEKTRHLFMVGQTRIHLDEVVDLGGFLELEVVLRPGQTAAEGQAVARELMRALEIDEGDLQRTAYIDLLARLNRA